MFHNNYSHLALRKGNPHDSSYYVTTMKMSYSISLPYFTVSALCSSEHHWWSILRTHVNRGVYLWPLDGCGRGVWEGVMFEGIARCVSQMWGSDILRHPWTEFISSHPHATGSTADGPGLGSVQPGVCAFGHIDETPEHTDPRSGQDGPCSVWVRGTSQGGCFPIHHRISVSEQVPLGTQ